MKSNRSIFILIIMASIILTGCSSNINMYEGEYIAFDYPDDLIIETYDNHILCKNELGFEFVINIEEIEDIKTEEETRTQAEGELENGIKMAEKMLTMEVISYEDIKIGGVKAKELRLEHQLVDGAIEQVYYILNEDMAMHDEINNYLDKYEEAKVFINEMKNDPQKLERLKIIISKLESETQEKQKVIMAANGLLDNVYHYINEEKSFVNIVKKQNIIAAVKENIVLRIYFQSNKEDYEKNLETAQEVIDSISFID